jgi:ADP-ribosylglycohydrolase
MHVIDRARGCLVGLAVGDALGAPHEFRRTGPVTTMTELPYLGGLPAGTWTDDTALAICLGQSLISGRFDPLDQLAHYRRWLFNGVNSLAGPGFGAGEQTRRVLRKSKYVVDEFPGDRYPDALGNGSLMRLAPVPIAYHRDPERAIHLAGQSSRTTHGGAQAVDACRYFAGVVVGALEGRPHEELLQPRFSPLSAWQPAELHPEIEAVADGSYRVTAPTFGDTYVVRTFEAALWAFSQADSFADGALAAVNLGGDTDTVAAVYGQIAGAYFGYDAIPQSWRQLLREHERIDALAIALHDLEPRTES